MFWRTGRNFCMTKQPTSCFIIAIFIKTLHYQCTLSKDLILIIFSYEVTSRSRTKIFPSLICQYFPNRLSRGLLWNLDVNTKPCPSPSKSSISSERQRRVLTSAGLVCAVNVNFSQLKILSVCHVLTHSAIAGRNGGFWSSITAALPR